MNKPRYMLLPPDAVRPHGYEFRLLHGHVWQHGDPMLVGTPIQADAWEFIFYRVRVKPSKKKGGP